MSEILAFLLLNLCLDFSKLIPVRLKVHDPYVSIEELGIHTSSDIDDVLLVNPDLIIISTAHSKYKQMISFQN